MQFINIRRFDWSNLRPLKTALTPSGKPHKVLVFIFIRRLFTLTFTDNKLEYEAFLLFTIEKKYYRIN